jgi:hypothetical protein
LEQVLEPEQVLELAQDPDPVTALAPDFLKSELA